MNRGEQERGEHDQRGHCVGFAVGPPGFGLGHSKFLVSANARLTARECSAGGAQTDRSIHIDFD
jgi:hypothetical protein